jgi:hypothetical protein
VPSQAPNRVEIVGYNCRIFAKMSLSKREIFRLFEADALLGHQNAELIDDGDDDDDNDSD